MEKKMQPEMDGSANPELISPAMLAEVIAFGCGTLLSTAFHIPSVRRDYPRQRLGRSSAAVRDGEGGAS